MFKWGQEWFSKYAVHVKNKLSRLVMSPRCSTDIALYTAHGTFHLSVDQHTLKTVLPEDMFDVSDELIVLPKIALYILLVVSPYVQNILVL